MMIDRERREDFYAPIMLYIVNANAAAASSMETMLLSLDDVSASQWPMMGAVDRKSVV